MGPVGNLLESAAQAADLKAQLSASSSTAEAAEAGDASAAPKKTELCICKCICICRCRCRYRCICIYVKVCVYVYVYVACKGTCTCTCMCIYIYTCISPIYIYTNNRTLSKKPLMHQQACKPGMFPSLGPYLHPPRTSIIRALRSLFNGSWDIVKGYLGGAVKPPDTVNPLPLRNGRPSMHPPRRQEKRPNCQFLMWRLRAMGVAGDGLPGALPFSGQKGPGRQKLCQQ